MQTATMTRRPALLAGSPRRVPIPTAEPTSESRAAKRRRPVGAQAGAQVSAQVGAQVGAQAKPITQGSLALDLAEDKEDEHWFTSCHLSLVDEIDDDDEDQFFAPQRTPRVQLPHPKPWCARFVQALIEVLAGERPAVQLMRWTSDGIFAEVNHRARLIAQARGPVTPSQPRPRVRTQGRGGSASRAGSAAGRLAVRSVHVSEPADGVAEAAVHVQHGNRSRAIAVRIEGLDGRWRCTALELG
jgi:Family of unknown function (DUF6459)